MPNLDRKDGAREVPQSWRLYFCGHGSSHLERRSHPSLLQKKIPTFPSNHSIGISLPGADDRPPAPSSRLRTEMEHRRSPVLSPKTPAPPMLLPGSRRWQVKGRIKGLIGLIPRNCFFPLREENQRVNSFESLLPVYFFSFFPPVISGFYTLKWSPLLFLKIRNRNSVTSKHFTFFSSADAAPVLYFVFILGPTSKLLSTVFSKYYFQIFSSFRKFTLFKTLFFKEGFDNAGHGLLPPGQDICCKLGAFIVFMSGVMGLCYVRGIAESSSGSKSRSTDV